MYLKQFIFVNWGNLPNQIFDFGPLNLLSGGNGSGKTTAADAIQTLMTAAHDNLYSFNPGQDESTQRTRGKTVRTLASYFLGCDDGSYSRPQRTDGYLAANFWPSEGEEVEPFAVVLHGRAHLEQSGSQRVARLDSLQFFLLRGQQLSLEDFVHDHKISDGAKFGQRLAQRYPSHLIERYDRKKSYLGRLYGALRGKDDAVSDREAMHCAKTFARFMAYKPVRSINDFVANEVLEKKDLAEAIRNVSSLMKTIHGMESSAGAIRASTELLEKAQGHASFFISEWLATNELQYTAAQSRYLSDQRDYVQAKKVQQQVRANIQDNSDSRSTLEQQQASLRQQLISLEAQKQGLSGADAVRLEQELKKTEADLARCAKAALEEQTKVDSALAIARFLSAGENKISTFAESDALVEVARSVTQNYQTLDLSAIMSADWIDESRFDELAKSAMENQRLLRRLTEVASPTGLGGTFYQSLQAEQAKLAGEHQSLTKSCQSLQQQIDSLEQSRSSYPRYVSHALAVLAESLPRADARVMCDYVSVDDVRWQSAIEGYLGGARFNIIVDEDFEAEAAEILRKHPDVGRGVRVVQGRKARADMAKLSRVASDSIVQLMRFEHAAAEAFITASFANVLQVDTTRDLGNVRRGLTANGLGAAGYAIFKCGLSDHELVFGKGARERSKLAKREQLSSELEKLGRTSTQRQIIGDALKQLASVQPVTIGDELLNVANALQSSNSLRKQISLLEAGDHGELDVQLAQVLSDERSLAEELGQLQIALGTLNSELSQIERKIERSNRQQLETEALVDEAEANLRELAARWPDYDLENAIISADERASEESAKSLTELATQKRDELGASINQLESCLIKHNATLDEATAIPFMPQSRQLNKALFDCVVDTHTLIDVEYNRLKNNVLAKKYEQLKHYKESFDNTFVTHLCHSVYQSVSDGERALEDLNAELIHHAFGADRERYSFGWEWEPEFKEYWDFFAEVTRAPSIEGATNSLFDSQLSAKYGHVRDRLMAMLLDEDEQRALKNLEDLTDYRRYRRYEIYKTPEGKKSIALSEYGTGSGGQLETPAYIIRAAAITSAFKFSESGSHLRMVLVDEAFSKMDEHRSREVIDYLTNRLGLQLSFVMPTSKSGPFMDLISNQFVFAKVPVGAKRGELATGVLVDRQILNQERVAELWESHRQQLRSQAELEFLAEL
ncbi:SbcC/MukB-like Walker B domain-containing protein [uncultured Umboniibacter sp.]|uniref:ATP-binding protein n=1 Tax=uncultured Umboniibacter sp. TaxID=1798917 RepID=UPI002639C9CD|nr:SbcC/MukB-like Walker B domain-containing protein [uncultured Umboniibacter sp.]